MNKEGILDFIKETEPIKRSDLVQRLLMSGQISRRNIYYHINALMEQGEVVMNRDKELVSRSPETKWIIPTVLAQNINVTPIINAYGNKDEQLKKLVSSLVEDYGGELTKLLCDLLIMLNVTVKGFEHSHRIKNLQPVGEFELDKYFSSLRYILDHRNG